MIPPVTSSFTRVGALAVLRSVTLPSALAAKQRPNGFLSPATVTASARVLPPGGVTRTCPRTSPSCSGSATGRSDPLTGSQVFV